MPHIVTPFNEAERQVPSNNEPCIPPSNGIGIATRSDGCVLGVVKNEDAEVEVQENHGIEMIAGLMTTAANLDFQTQACQSRDDSSLIELSYRVHFSETMKLHAACLHLLLHDEMRNSEVAKEKVAPAVTQVVACDHGFGEKAASPLLLFVWVERLKSAVKNGCSLQNVPADAKRGTKQCKKHVQFD